VAQARDVEQRGGVREARGQEGRLHDLRRERVEDVEPPGEGEEGDGEVYQGWVEGFATRDEVVRWVRDWDWGCVDGLANLLGVHLGDWLADAVGEFGLELCLVDHFVGFLLVRWEGNTAMKRVGDIGGKRRLSRVR
jgi:hypothetical protein